MQCKGDNAVSFGRKAATRASFPPCWDYMAHQCRRSRHRRAHSCCRSLIHARKDSVHCRWYALVRHITRDSLFTISFDRIIDIRLTEEHFKIDKDFDAQSWFSDCYGVFRNQDAELERVVVRAYGREAFYLRDLPFHHSQREIASGEDWTDFEYWLRISNDFYTPLLSRGPNIKVLQPQWLAEEIRQQLLKAAGLYEER